MNSASGAWKHSVHFNGSNRLVGRSTEFRSLGPSPLATGQTSRARYRLRTGRTNRPVPGSFRDEALCAALVLALPAAKLRPTLARSRQGMAPVRREASNTNATTYPETGRPYSLLGAARA